MKLERRQIPRVPTQAALGTCASDQTLLAYQTTVLLCQIGLVTRIRGRVLTAPRTEFPLAPTQFLVALDTCAHDRLLGQFGSLYDPHFFAVRAISSSHYKQRISARIFALSGPVAQLVRAGDSSKWCVRGESCGSNGMNSGEPQQCGWWQS